MKSKRKKQTNKQTNKQKKQQQRTLPTSNAFCRLWWMVLIIIYPLTARVVGALQTISQPVSSIFSLLHCPLRLGELQAYTFPNVVFSPLPLSALSSPFFHCALQDGFDQTWWTGDMTIPLQFASLYDGQEVFVWSGCLLDLGMDRGLHLVNTRHGFIFRRHKIIQGFTLRQQNTSSFIFSPRKKLFTFIQDTDSHWDKTSAYI